MNSVKKQEKGFSLIELIVVLVITGILAAVAYPSYSRFLTDSRTGEAEAVIGAMAAAMKAARQQTTSYATITPLTPGAGTPVDISVGPATTIANGIYLIGTVQVDTGEGPSFSYTLSNLNTNTFQITAAGRANGLVSDDTLIYDYNGASASSRVTWSVGANSRLSAP